MILDAINVTGAERLLPSIQKDLALLASGLDSRFVQAGTTLAAAIETIDHVIAALDGVTSALDEQKAGGAVRSLTAIAERLTGLPAAQAARSDELSAVASKTVLLSEQVMVMHQTLRLLRIYGVNIKIAASGEEEFVSFIDRMGTTLAAGEEELNAFLVTLKDIDASVASAQQAERILAVECGKVVPAVPGRLVSDAAELEAHLMTVAEAAKRIGVIARDIQCKVGVILGALQVGDRTRQRLEHVVSSLQILESWPPLEETKSSADPAIFGHVCRLLSAHLDATAADFDADAKLLLDSLCALGPDTARLLELLNGESGDDGRTFLLRLERGITDVERLTTQLHEADQRSGLMLDTLALALQALTERAENLCGMRLDVQSIAVNTGLMCRRFADVGRAVSVIAREMDASASKMGSVLNDVIRPIRELGQISLSMRETQRAVKGFDAGKTLTGALDVIREGCRRTERAVNKGRDDAQQIGTIMDGVSTKLSRELALGEVMRRAGLDLAVMAGDKIPLSSAADAALRPLLMAVSSLYTMAEEREIHTDFVLPGMDLGTSTVPGKDTLFEAEDDDGLF